MMQTTHEQPARALDLHFEGTFDIAAARRLIDLMCAAPAESEIYVDFARVNDFRDAAVAVLSQALRQFGTRASVRGLRRHQYRLLQYLGAPRATLQPVL